jgi:hypothetical protein
MRATRLRHEFVELIPNELVEETLYISIPYATAMHLCACGCGHRVVTPLAPTDWRLIFDGESVSLDPSIGNWSFDCQSHYWIKDNRVLWARRWSRDRIDAGRADDRLLKRQHFGEPVSRAKDARVEKVAEAAPSGSWVRRWFGRRRG